MKLIYNKTMDKLILTETKNPASENIDNLTTLEIVEVINNEDKKVALAVQQVLNDVAKGVDIIVQAFENDGSLLYFGAGTSGRLGVLDASECPPTFSAPVNMVRGYIAGGDKALRFSTEGAEDSFDGGIEDLINSGANEKDIVVGISASGNAPYIFGVLSKARKLKAKTIGIACNTQAKMKEHCDVFICPEVGPEILTGSTRLKSGTAQKMVLNMLTTASMIKIGKTYKNYMIDLNPSNTKLRDRATRILSEVAEISYDEAAEKLKEHKWHLRQALKSL